MFDALIFVVTPQEKWKSLKKKLDKEEKDGGGEDEDKEEGKEEEAQCDKVQRLDLK